ncbi:MAG TPA: 2-oxo acid dehydrogenase subunit E2 [Glycomyces sp.]|nr:2-oxo acid dehydrogenase subunit E2 [Glycomyces sp.]
MPTSVTMPALGESVTEGTVTQWLKNEGDTVEVDEPLLEVSTDKVDTEVPSPVAGVVLKIVAPEDSEVEIGGELAIIGDPSEAGGDAPAPEPAAEEPAEEPQSAPAPEAPSTEQTEAQSQAQGESSGGRAEGTEVRLPELGESVTDGTVTAWLKAVGDTVEVDEPLLEISTDKVDTEIPSPAAGTLLEIRVGEDETAEVGSVLAVIDQKATAKPAAEPAKEPAAAKPAAPVEVSPLRGRTEKMSRLRQSAAKSLLQSMQTTAQLTTVREVDVTKVANLRAAKKDEFLERHGVKLSYLPFFSVAAIEALKQYPVINASMNMEEKTITYPESENVGFAVDTPKGLIVPVVKDAGDLNIPGLAKRIAEIARKAREGGLAPDDLFGATFTITNTGSVGALFDTPIVPLGQSAILGTAAIVKRPRVINDPELGEVIAVRSIMHLTLSYDHRLIDGADAARFLEAVTKRIEEGNFEHQLGL